VPTPTGDEPHILIIEDEAIVAAAMSRGLRVCGAVVIGPAATPVQALALIESTPRIDGALVDINLRGVQAYDVADALIAKRIPMVFATGYDASTIPSRYRGIAVLQKPFDVADAMKALALAAEGSA
jgi:CheY-like chemotaxis protein